MASKYTPPGYRPGGNDRPVDGDQNSIDQLQRAIGTLPVVVTNDRVSANRTDKVEYLLGNSDYPMNSASLATDTHVYSTGANITAMPDVENNLNLTGCKVGAINVGSLATVIFMGCEITGTVTVASGGHVHCIGCRFTGSGYVNNAGVITNCYITSCHKTSPTAHTNCTIIAQT